MQMPTTMLPLRVLLPHLPYRRLRVLIRSSLLLSW
jgi:hypothetical protein